MYHWIEVTSQAAFAPRDGAGALVFQDRMWLLGGWNPADKHHFPHICNSEVWSSADGREWTLELAQAPWEGRHTAGYAVLSEQMWIIGGDANQGHYQNDVWSSTDGKSWICRNAQAPWAPRVLQYCVSFGGYLWVIGGQALPHYAPAPEQFYSDVWRSRDGLDWQRVSHGLPWGPRGMIGGSAVFQDQIWMLGGGTYDTPARPRRTYYNDVWSSYDGINWEKRGVAPWHPRQYHDVAVFDDHLWVLEGYHQDGGNRKDVWYSSDGSHWQEVPESPFVPRHAASVFVFDEALWLVAGNNMESDVWKLVRN